MVKKHSFSLIFSLMSFASANAEQTELMELSVEDLLNVNVTSVAKKSQSLNDAAAAVYVISQEDIKRIGATSIPEALRLAPGINVARIDSNKWAVSARGFNGRLANKLLVLIDGRNAYTRAFAGVYWENQDVMLEDVDRIEVIRGPGATLWGSNAVNGVINIITKHSADTQGGLIAVGGGNQEQGFGAFRYGAELSKNTAARVYLKGFKRGGNTLQSGDYAGDSWDKVQTGFRMDSNPTLRDMFTLQGDMYSSNVDQHTTLPQLTAPYQNSFNEIINSFGGNILARQRHIFSSSSEASLQVFYDFYDRNDSVIRESRHTVDIDFQHRFAFLSWNDVVWGLGYRFNADDLDLGAIANVQSPHRNDHLYSAFVQDEITLLENTLWLTLGSKFEHNDYSGFEVQPTARLMWVPQQQHRLWAAVSRAVRTPSRGEHDLNLLIRVFPPAPTSQFPFLTPAIAQQLNGNKNFDSEEVISYELGYRTTFIKNLSIDATAFYNRYHNLRSADVDSVTLNGSYLDQIVKFNNNHSARTYGFELATVWQMLDWWRWDVNYSLLKTDLYGQDPNLQIAVGPQQRVTLRSAISPTENVNFDLFFRYVDRSSAVSPGSPIINDYVSLDLRLAWKPIKQIELAMVAQNLLASHHLEYIQEAFTQATEINRSFYGKLSWRF